MCFVQRENELLLLNRVARPNMGLWTGTGGKIEIGETPEQGILREVEEETSLRLRTVEFIGVVTWVTEHETDGMYMFMANIEDAANGNQQPAVQATKEGILAWKPVPWVLDPQNVGIAPHLRRVLRTVLLEQVQAEHRCRFVDDTLVDYQLLPLSEEYVRQVSDARKGN